MAAPGEDAAREALRARQGAGARYAAPAAPHEDLLLARRGTAYFFRKLNELSDEALFAASLKPGWTRARVVAHVSYRARKMARLAEGLRTGVAQSAGPAAGVPTADAGLGASLPARALRHLFHHSACHLDVEWRDLPGREWDTGLHVAGQGLIPARELPKLRAADLWHCALELGNGARTSDVPQELRSIVMRMR